MGLSPGFDEGAADDAGADEGDLGYYSVGLRGVSLGGGGEMLGGGLKERTGGGSYHCGQFGGVR